MRATTTDFRLAMALVCVIASSGCGGSAPAADAALEPEASGEDAVDDLSDALDGDAMDVVEDAVQETVDATDGDGPIEGTRAARVLFIGNSYTSVNQLHVIVAGLLDEADLGGTTVAVAPGGYTLDQHADDADGTSGDTELRDLLVTGPEAELGWDVVVLQQQSQIPGFPHDEPLWVAMVEGATTLRDLASATGADTVLFMTWGYRDGDPLNPSLYPDYPTMQDRISQGYTDLADILDGSGDGTFIAPVGEAFRSVYLSGADTVHADLYAADASHPSIRGSYLAACVIFATLTGTSPVGLTSAPTELDASTRLDLQQVAAAVVLDASAPDRWTR